MKTIRILAFILLVSGIALGDQARADTIIPPDLHVMCHSIPQKDMKVLIDPCRIFYEKKAEAVEDIGRIIKDAAESQDSPDPEGVRGEVLAWRVTLVNYMTVFNTACAVTYTGAAIPEKLAAAMDKERTAMDLAIESYAHMAWIAASVSNDREIVKDSASELQKKLEELRDNTCKENICKVYADLKEKSGRLDKLTSQEIKAAYSAASRLKVAMTALKTTLENFKTGYQTVIDTYSWDNRKEMYNDDILGDFLSVVDELYKDERWPSQWIDIYDKNKPYMTNLGDRYKESLEYLVHFHEAWLGDNIFKFFDSQPTTPPPFLDQGSESPEKRVNDMFELFKKAAN